MNLVPLNLDDFYDEKNSHFDNGSGIAGIGVITDNNIYNFYSLYNGLGSHDDTFDYILKELFSLNKIKEKKEYQNNFKKIIGNVIRISYWNAIDDRCMLFHLPTVITLKKLDKLKSLKEYYRDVFDKYPITVTGTFEKFDVSGTQEIYTDSALFITNNNIDPVIKYAEKLYKRDYEVKLLKERKLKCAK